MKFNQIRHNDTTCYSKIKWEQLQVHACKAVHPNCKLLAQAVQLNRRILRNPADHHSGTHPVLIAGWEPGARGDHRGTIFAFCTIAIKKYKWERKAMEIDVWWKMFYSFCFAEMFYWFSDHFGWQQKFSNFFYVLVIFCMLI
jgi:hypothetical protein